ncbi:hypothetical protein [Bartonella gabonensis]|uniref:hypothetical protein n=1 Tax=Bartonella gabonensis TaxID=2699889 RepID=UPI00158A6A80|nr:hypothetical protein [Bartonella gabonensis]
MIIKYLFAIFALLLIFLSIVKASECTILPREASISTTDLVFNKQSDHLLNKVILPAHPGDHSIFWEKTIFLFQKAKHVYTDLGMYLYNSILSIFKWYII